jgi:hypothetical protein
VLCAIKKGHHTRVLGYEKAPSMTPQDYYRTQSTLSDPGAYGYLFDALPNDLDSLCYAVRNVYVHYMSNRLDLDQQSDVDTRTMENILATIIGRNSTSLMVERPLHERFIGCCRDASLLLCAILRHKGIPARLRVGFAPYINLGVKDFAVDHVITEVWDAALNRWKFVDAEQDAYLIEFNRVDFDVHDIPPYQFIVGGAAWTQMRSGAVSPDVYGYEATEADRRGEGAIRNQLLLDVAALNKAEVLLWDAWGWTDLDLRLSNSDNALLDHIAALSLAGDFVFEAMQTAYLATPSLTVPPHLLGCDPAALTMTPTA